DRHYPDEVAAWSRLHASEFSQQQRRSKSIEFAEQQAASLARQMSPPVDQVDSRLLLAGVLLEGDRRSNEQLAFSWLSKTISGDRATLLGLTAVSTDPVSATLPYAPDAQAVLDRAAVIASVTNSPAVVRGRHLVGALLWEPLAQGAAELLGKAGEEGSDLAERLVAWVEPWAAKAEKDGWRRLLAGLDARTVRFAGYDNDDAAGEDRLNLQRDVQALAAVLASKHITPPLSVGLFGDWGSGKSFFMKQLRDHVQFLAESSRKAAAAQRPTDYCGEVIQIDFNAWHYMDANLWASLVAHIFDELNAQLNMQKKSTAEAYAASLASVKERREELAAEKKGLQA